MFNISIRTREHNPCVHSRRTAMSGFDTWTMIAAYSRTATSSVRLRLFLTIGAGVLADHFTSLPRHTCDRLYSINDAEASWRGWQVNRVHGGFGRLYHDPAFKALDSEEPAAAA